MELIGSVSNLVLYLVVLLVCPNSGGCSSPTQYMRYISEPFGIESVHLHGHRTLQQICIKNLDIMLERLGDRVLPGHRSFLCVKKEIWDERHGTTY